MTKLYGIKNCDTMKKAFRWLDEQGVDYDFHDYKKQGIDANTIKEWLKQAPWDQLINRRGTTWRKLPEDQKENMDEALAIEVMQDNPSIIKRPVLMEKGNLYLGFKPEQYQEIFQ